MPKSATADLGGAGATYFPTPQANYSVLDLFLQAICFAPSERASLLRFRESRMSISAGEPEYLSVYCEPCRVTCVVKKSDDPRCPQCGGKPSKPAETWSMESMPGYKRHFS